MLGVGAVFAGYRIEGILGRGGMGIVYLAQHPRLPRTVALKLLNRDVSTDAEVVRRFEREADVIARLEHPGIVGVLDRGATDGHLWIAMQYIRGTDAASWDAAAQPPVTVARLLGSTALALDYAHSRGILHRDVKPANIVIADGDDFRDAHAVLTDFGIAGLVESASTKITATGTFTATLAYASPEQLSGEVVDHRSDQYSLACTLFALLAGQPPYVATNPGQVVMSHISKPVPRITAVRSDLPVAIDAVLDRAMAKQRDGRFSSCTGFIDAALDALGYRSVADTVDPARIAPTVHASAPAETVVLDSPGARHAVATVNFARTAPTVHNSGPVGSQHPVGSPPPAITPGPVAAASAVQAPSRGNQTEGSARRKKLGIISGLVLTVLVISGVVLFNSQETYGYGPDKNSWGVPLYVVDAFPRLVPEQFDQGWRQGYCFAGESGPGRPSIRCSHRDNSGISFIIEDYSTPSAVQEHLNSTAFRYSEFTPTGPGLEHTSETKSAPNSALDAAAQMTVPPENSSASSAAAAYFSFPSDPIRGRYLITVKWPGHTADEVLREWWSQAPLDR